MKRKTAIKKANIISNKLKSLGGIISTPECHHEALIIRRAWVFGSTAKGSESPGDLDILLDFKLYGRKLNLRNLRKYKLGFWRGFPLDSELIGYRSLKSNMKMIRFHDYYADNEVGDIDKTKIMIYPKFGLLK